MMVESKQPETDAKVYIRLMQLAELEGYPYQTDSRLRDSWLRHFWRIEPHLAGVMNTVTLIDTNRGWTLVGGRRQVKRYMDVLHTADGGQGWRMFIRKASLSYWATDIGCITELGREGKNGPLRALYHVDSARCKLSGKAKGPLTYYPSNGSEQVWEANDFFRIASLPSDDEALYGLGFCAISRALEIVRLLYAVMLHDQELVAAKAPKGVLLLSNVSETQWEQSLQAREIQMDSMERRYYGGVHVLASSGADNPDAKLIALSQLPANFDAKTFTDLCMYSFALCFGYDPSEFWPVQFGSIGRGTEMQVQAVKATGKGGLDFSLAFQEKLQLELPDTLHFEFERRDEEGDLISAKLQQARLDIVRMAYESGLREGFPLISRDEARVLLAEQDLIPPTWTTGVSAVAATDTNGTPAIKDVAAQMLDTMQVRQAMETYPDEEIVACHWPSNRMDTLWVPRQRNLWPTSGPVRATKQGVLYESKSSGVVITDADVAAAIEIARTRHGNELANLLIAPDA